jgi:SHS2 domain-containing protein
VWAPDLSALLAEAGRALGELLLRGTAGTKDVRVRDVTVAARDREALLVDWLNELLYLAETERWVPTEFEMLEVSESVARARVRGVAVPQAPALVKAATHHGLTVAPADGGLRAEVIFDI